MYTYTYSTRSADIPKSGLQTDGNALQIVHTPAPESPTVAPSAVGTPESTPEVVLAPADSRQAVALPQEVAQASTVRRPRRTRSIPDVQEKPCSEVRYFLDAIGMTVQVRLAETHHMLSASENR